MNRKTILHICALIIISQFSLTHVKSSNKDEHLSEVLPDQILIEKVLPNLDNEALERFKMTSKGALEVSEQELDKVYRITLDDNTKELIKILDRLVSTKNKVVINTLTESGLLVNGKYFLPIDINNKSYSIVEPNLEEGSNYDNYPEKILYVLEVFYRQSKEVEEGLIPQAIFEGSIRGLYNALSDIELKKTPIKAGFSMRD